MAECNIIIRPFSICIYIHLSATFPLNDINSTPKSGGFKSFKGVYKNED
jgi:hypothetical protein